MRKQLRKVLRKLTIDFHMGMHAFIGVIIAFVIVNTVGSDAEMSTKTVVITGLIFSIIPDFEHILYYFTFGAKTEYSKTVKKHLRHGQIRSLYKFCSINHKDLTGLFMHNFLTAFAALLLGSVAMLKNHDQAAIAFIVVAAHYIYDIFEDYFLCGAINPNWFLKYNKKTHKM